MGEASGDGVTGVVPRVEDLRGGGGAVEREGADGGKADGAEG